METKQARVMLAAMLVLGGMLVYALTATGGSLEPSAPPESTMKTLQEIYDAVVSSTPSISQREGVCKFEQAPAEATTTILIVPEGKRFVLRKLWVFMNNPDWNIVGGTDLQINWYVMYTKYGTGESLMWDFPDGCAVVEGGNNLTFTNTHSAACPVTIVGYFYDAP